MATKSHRFRQPADGNTSAGEIEGHTIQIKQTYSLFNHLIEFIA